MLNRLASENSSDTMIHESVASVNGTGTHQGEGLLHTEFIGFVVKRH